MPGLRLERKHAVVSGGAAGAGGAASEVFAREGANVVIVDIQEEAGLALVEKICEAGGKASFVRADVSLNDEVDEAIDKANRLFDNRIDVLFNHAGTVIIKPFLETTESDWDRMMAINVKSMFLMTKAVLPSMLDQGVQSLTPLRYRQLREPPWKSSIAPARAHVICLPAPLRRSTVTTEFVATLFVLDLSERHTEYVNSRNYGNMVWRSLKKISAASRAAYVNRRKSPTRYYSWPVLRLAL